jgi:hypothetical protein
MLSQEVLVNVGTDSFADSSENYGTTWLFAVHHSLCHLPQRRLRVGNDADVRVHLSHKEVCQVSAVAGVDNHRCREKFFIGKYLDLFSLTAL